MLNKVYISSDSSSCSVGADDIASALRGECDIVRTGSRGLYFLEPMVEVETPNGRVAYTNLNVESIPRLIKAGILEGEPLKPYYAGLVDAIPFLKRQTRIVYKSCGVVEPTSIEQYKAQGGYTALHKTLFDKQPQGIIDEIKKSGLCGRGGAAFPTGIKWQTAKDYQADQKYIVANGDEGDPGTYADRMLMEGDPLLILEGMTIAAKAVGASKGYVYIRAEYPLAIKKMKQAIAVSLEGGYLGRNVLNSGFTFDVDIYVGAGAYVCGEETALLESIEGRRGMVRPKPPFPATHGLFQKPTVVNNIMTFGSVPAIIENGREWFASFGTEKSKGTIALQLGGSLRTPGLVEVPFGLTLEEIIFGFGGGMPKGRKFKAAQVGGPLGAIFPKHLLKTRICFDELAKAGGLLGHGGVVVFDDRTSMTDLARHFMEFCSHESCGKCTPCRIGSKRAEEILSIICKGNGQKGDLELIAELGETMRMTSLCALGGLAPMPVLTAMKYFSTEFVKGIRQN